MKVDQGDRMHAKEIWKNQGRILYAGLLGINLYQIIDKSINGKPLYSWRIGITTLRKR